MDARKSYGHCKEDGLFHDDSPVDIEAAVDGELNWIDNPEMTPIKIVLFIILYATGLVSMIKR
jgi:hypothetical protein